MSRPTAGGMERLSLSDSPGDSPTSASLTTRHHTPDLPPEMWAQILAFSVPPPSYDTWPARSSSLRSLALVSPTFRPIAQGLLLRDPVLPKLTHLSSLLSTLRFDAEDDEMTVERVRRLRSLVRSVRMGNRGASWSDGSAEVGTLLEWCERVEEVRLYQAGQMEIAQIAKGQALRRLFVVKTTLRHSPLLPAPLCLPHLQHLHLHLALANVDPLVARSLLTTQALPRLTALARFALGASATEAALVSTLTSLSLSKPPPAGLDCPRLAVWDCQSPLFMPTPPVGSTDLPAGRAEPAAFAPASVRVVRFSRPSLDLATAPDYLECFPVLEEVHVRDVVPPTSEGLAELERWCASKIGGAVRLVVEGGGEDYVEGLFGPQFWELVEREEGRRR